jgi:hypothetical protein
MGEWLGLPEWVAGTGFVVAALALWLALGSAVHHRAMKRLAARRPNPTEAEFLALMAQDCSPEAARFMWAQALPYVEPHVTPHPDDLLLDDLCIDDGDIDMDLCGGWAAQIGVPGRDLPEWPEGWPLTVRNFARWCDLARTNAPAA